MSVNLMNTIMASKMSPNAMYDDVMNQTGTPTSSQPMFQAPSQAAGGVDWNDILRRQKAAADAERQRQQSAAWMNQHRGTEGAQYAQAPLAQATPIQGLMQMVGQGGPQQQAGGQVYSNPYMMSLMGGM